MTELFEVGRDFHVPGMLVLHSDPAHPERVTRKTVLDFKMIKGLPTAYVCEKNVCNLPVTKTENLAKEFQRYRAS